MKRNDKRGGLAMFFLKLAAVIGIVAFMGSCGKENVQALCPIMGAEIDRSLFTDYESRRVYVCCMGCIEAFHQHPDRFIKFLEEDKKYELEKAKDDGLSNALREYCKRHKGHGHR